MELVFWADLNLDRPFVFLDWSEFYNRRAGRCCSSRDKNGHRSRWKCQTDQSCSRKRTTTSSTYIQTFSYLSVCHQALNHCHFCHHPSFVTLPLSPQENNHNSVVVRAEQEANPPDQTLVYIKSELPFMATHERLKRHAVLQIWIQMMLSLCTKVQQVQIQRNRWIEILR